MQWRHHVTKFWQNWLTIWAVGVAIFGLVLAGGAFAATDGLTRFLFLLFQNPLPAGPDQHHRFAIGLMGAVTLGWGLTYLVSFKALHALDHGVAAPLWRGMTLASLAWYVIDSSISIATGFWLNAVSNTLVIALYLVAVIGNGALRRV
jgi:hypothetical protein